MSSQEKQTQILTEKENDLGAGTVPSVPGPAFQGEPAHLATTNWQEMPRKGHHQGP